MYLIPDVVPLKPSACNRSRSGSTTAKPLSNADIVIPNNPKASLLFSPSTATKMKEKKWRVQQPNVALHCCFAASAFYRRKEEEEEEKKDSGFGSVLSTWPVLRVRLINPNRTAFPHTLQKCVGHVRKLLRDYHNWTDGLIIDSTSFVGPPMWPSQLLA